MVKEDEENRSESWHAAFGCLHWFHFVALGGCPTNYEVSRTTVLDLSRFYEHGDYHGGDSGGAEEDGGEDE